MTLGCSPCNCPTNYIRDEFTWRGAIIKVLCDILTAISAGSFGPLAPKSAEYSSKAVLWSAITAVFANDYVLPANTRQIILDNQTNGVIEVSMDLGGTTFLVLRAGDSRTIAFADLNLVSSATIEVKYSTAPTSGYLRMNAIY